jgi:hypothetical protein
MNDPDHYRLPTKVPTALGGRTAGYFGRQKKGMHRFIWLSWSRRPAPPAEKASSSFTSTSIQNRYERIARIPSAIGARTSAYYGQVGKHNRLYLAIPGRSNRGVELWIYQTRD